MCYYNKKNLVQEAINQRVNCTNLGQGLLENWNKSHIIQFIILINIDKTM